MGNNPAELFKETVRESYDWLRPAIHEGNKHKTNKAWCVGRKVIITRAFTNYGWGRLSLGEYAERNLIQVDKIFHLLDGAAFSDCTYTGDLVSDISSRDGKREGETGYFKWKAYQNGNLHLVFKREDLLKSYNQIAGGMIEPALKGW